mmetsp:Transcript_11736/g.33887  ORF Transcript_11736/g.33887 Transcript_11736/m.33887 type:complete len:202 (-) Transcript_11736:844-1449(-)
MSRTRMLASCTACLLFVPLSFHVAAPQPSEPSSARLSNQPPPLPSTETSWSSVRHLEPKEVAMGPLKVVVDIWQGVIGRVHGVVELLVGVVIVMVVPKEVAEGLEIRGIMAIARGGGLPGLIVLRVSKSHEVPDAVNRAVDDPKGHIVRRRGLEHVPEVARRTEVIQHGVVDLLGLFLGVALDHLTDRALVVLELGGVQRV